MEDTGGIVEDTGGMVEDTEGIVEDTGGIEDTGSVVEGATAPIIIVGTGEANEHSIDTAD